MSALARSQNSGTGSVEAYLAWEREQVERHEYIAGEIHAMVGASLAHGRILFNLAKALDAAVEPGSCAVFVDGAKLRVGDAVFCPDVMVSCQGFDLKGDLIGAPVLIAEVLSPSTELHDRGVKWRHYQRLPSRESYVLVAQDRAMVEVFARRDGSWTYASHVGAEERVVLEYPRCTLRVGDLYAGLRPR